MVDAASTEGAVGGSWVRGLALWKLGVLSVATLGIYPVGWFYRNWRSQRDRAGADISPFWRTFFSPFVAYWLFRDVRAEAASYEVAVFSPGALAAAYLLWLATMVLPGAWSLLALLSVAPLLPVQRSMNAVARANGAPIDRSFTARHLLAVWTGGALILLLAWSMTHPQF